MNAGKPEIGDVYRFPRPALPNRSPKGNRYTSRIFSGGFTYITVLIAVAVITASLGAAATVYSQSAQRDKEAELLFIGHQYRDAIASYYERSPGGDKRYPQKLEDLLEDRRWPVLVRHLRRLYKDPVTGEDFAPVEAPGGAGIMGVASRSETQPLKTGNFRPKDEDFEKAKTYADWKFTYSPAGLSPSQHVSQPSNKPAPAK